MDMAIDAAFTVKILTRFISEELGKKGFRRGILGLSGGLDSAVCARWPPGPSGRRTSSG